MKIPRPSNVDQEVLRRFESDGPQTRQVSRVSLYFRTEADRRKRSQLEHISATSGYQDRRARRSSSQSTKAGLYASTSILEILAIQPNSMMGKLFCGQVDFRENHGSREDYSKGH
jgi:hypothetical protein